MRILHTADWHLGLRLYKKELHEEHRQFFDWLVQLIQSRGIDVLMISGDVFDQANPTREASKLYYEFLSRLVQVKCRVIITGGNHDSPGVLNAPKDILEMLQVHVIGNIPEKIEDLVIEIREEEESGRGDLSGRLIAVVCAVPYIREPDIHRFTLGETFDDKLQQLSAGVRNYYQSLENYCKARYQVPVIAMGHLYAAGASTSDSEREIQIGYQSPVNATDFPEGFAYIALGHIHRPQRVAKQERIRYSGSPIPLSFSEKNDRKIVIELEVKGDSIIQTDHEVPVYRKLVKFSGTFEGVKKDLEKFINRGEVKAWAELQVIEEQATPALQSGVNTYVADFQGEAIEILNHRITSTAATQGINDWADNHVQLEDLSPVMVLSKMMETGGVTAEHQAVILQAFRELTEMEEETEDE